MRAGRLDFGAGSARPCARGTKPRRSNVGQTLLSLSRALARSLALLHQSGFVTRVSRARRVSPNACVTQRARPTTLPTLLLLSHHSFADRFRCSLSLSSFVSSGARQNTWYTARVCCCCCCVFPRWARGRKISRGRAAAGRDNNGRVHFLAGYAAPRSRNTHDSLAYFGIPFGLLSVIYAALPAAIVEFLCTLYTYSRAYNSSEKAIQKFQIDWLWLILVASALFDASSVYACFQKRRENSRRDDWIPVRLIVLIYAAARLVSEYIPRVKM